MKRAHCIIFVLVLLCFTLTGFGQDEEKDIHAKLKGKWHSTAVIYDGKRYAIEGLFANQLMEFDNGKFTSQYDKKDFFGEYKIDPSKDPMWITIVYDRNTNKPYQGTSFRGLFSIDDDKLIIVTNVQRRPKELSSKKHSGNMLVEFERVKED